MHERDEQVELLFSDCDIQIVCHIHLHVNFGCSLFLLLVLLLLLLLLLARVVMVVMVVMSDIGNKKRRNVAVKIERLNHTCVRRRKRDPRRRGTAVSVTTITVYMLALIAHFTDIAEIGQFCHGECLLLLYAIGSGEGANVLQIKAQGRRGSIDSLVFRVDVVKHEKEVRVGVKRRRRGRGGRTGVILITNDMGDIVVNGVRCCHCSRKKGSKRGRQYHLNDSTQY